MPATAFVFDAYGTLFEVHAAIALGGIGKDSEPAVRLLADKIQDTREARDVRFQCATALTKIGAVPYALEADSAML